MKSPTASIRCLWAIHVLGTTPHEWQKKFLRVSRGKEIKVLTSRQVGKTTAAAIGMAHTAVFMPRSLSVVACPSQRQSAEAIRKVRDMVLKAGATLTSDNVYGLELENEFTRVGATLAVMIWYAV